MDTEDKNRSVVGRREFMTSCARIACVTALCGGGAYLVSSKGKENPADVNNHVWQIDPSKCIQCGNCATECVLAVSAVKCVHLYSACGYCDLCGAYFQPGTKELTTGAENQLCPTGAIRRTYIEEPYYEYNIDENLCIGCAECVKGCDAFGNGSLVLQVRHDRCLNCNECNIAKSCPAQAFRRVPSSSPSLIERKST